MSEPITTHVDTPVPALLVDVDGTISDLALDRSAPMGILTGMYDGIGCHTVECVDLAEDLSVWFDENALMAGDKSVNMPISLYLQDVYEITHQLFWGAAVFTGGVDRNGDTIGISEQQAAAIRRYLTA